MNATLRITGTLAATLTLAFTLTACSTANAPAVQETTTPAATTAPVETPAVVETPAPVAGATITSDDEAAAAEAAGLGVYDVFDADGNYVNSVVFDKAAPLPDAIKADIAAPVLAAFDEGTAAGLGALGPNDVASPEQAAAQSAQASAATSAAHSATREAGRNVVLVFKYYTGAGVRWGATSGDSQIRNSAGASADESIAKAQAWIASQSDPAAYEIVIAG